MLHRLLASASLACLVLLPIAAPIRAQTTSLVHYASMGLQAGEEFAAVVVDAGDLNGDGIPDQLVGAPSYDNGAPDTGRVQALCARTRQLLYSVVGDRTSVRLGAVLASIGDVNADGVPDWVAGEPGYDQTATDGGRVRCHSGKDGRLLWVVRPTGRLSHFGNAVLGVPDLNRDGVPDVAVGAPGDRAGVFGRVWTLSGTTGLPIGSSFLDASVSSLTGSSLALIGDLNRDGIPDIVAGRPGSNNLVGSAALLTLTSRGPSFYRTTVHTSGQQLGAYVANVDSSRRLLLIGGRTLAGGAGRVVLYDADQARELASFTGTSATGGLDFDGDRVPDFAIGNMGLNSGDGSCTVYSGRGFGALFTRPGRTGSRAGFGWSMQFISDVNADGIVDLAVGSRGPSPFSGFLEVIGLAIPSSVRATGPGCAGSAGTPALTAATSGISRTGRTIVDVRNLPATGRGLWVLGALPAQLPLAVIGAPGCTLLESTDALLPWSAVGGRVVLNVQHPWMTSLLRARVFVQCASFDPPANPAGLVMSNGVEIILGNF